MEEMRHLKNSWKMVLENFLSRAKMSDIVNIAWTAYNFLPTAEDSSFFLMFGRDLYICTLANLLQPKLRHLGDALALLSEKMFRKVNVVAVVNFEKKKVRDGQPAEVIKDIPKFKVGDILLLRNHKKHTTWDIRYMSDIWIYMVISDRAYDHRTLLVIFDMIL